MPFGLKQTVEISGHYSEAQSGSMQKLSEDAEVSGKQWKTVEDKWKVRKMCRSKWKTRKGLEGVRRGQKRCGRVRKRSGSAWESAEGTGRHGNVTLCYKIPICRLLQGTLDVQYTLLPQLIGLTESAPNA